MDEETIRRLEEKVNQLEGSLSRWKGWRNGLFTVIAIVIALVVGIWNGSVDNINSRFKVMENDMSIVEARSLVHVDTLSHLITLSKSEREQMERMHKRLDKLFSRVNGLHFYPSRGNK